MRGVATTVGGSNPNYDAGSSRRNDQGRGRDQVVGGSNYNYSSSDSRTGSSSRSQDYVGGGSSYSYPSIPSRGYPAPRRDTSWGYNWYPSDSSNYHWTPTFWFPRENRDNRHYGSGNNRPIRGCCASLCAGLAVSAFGVAVRSVQLVAFGVILGVGMAMSGGCDPD